MSTKRRQRLCSFVYEGMRDRMERFIVLPFGIGCASQSSIAIGPSDDHHQPKRSAVNNNVGPRKDGDRRAEGGKTKNMAFHFFSLRRSARISSGMQRLIRRSIKGFSQIFVYKEEDEDVMEEKEMEIGLPTDVKHVTHIGLDGSTTTNIAHPSSINQNGSSWESFKAPADLLSNFSSISLKQFELAMDAQTTHHQIPNILRS